VESLESREMWKGFILTVVELRVPSNLTLLPGHLYMMAEALAKEEARRALEMPSGGPKQLPPSSIAPVSSQDKLPPLLNQDENYVIPTGDAPAANYVNQDVPSPSRPVVPKPRKLATFQAKPPKPPIVPKSEPKKGLNSGLARKLAVSSAQAFSSPTTGLADVTAELKGKLQRRLALEHAAECTGDQWANLQVWHISQADPSSQN
ncbi:Signal-transducing adaptor protein 2, partial [Eschrichtius robustus]|nr:Signal-transducing adaptor protein 2 [Eschrichtius robustus]